MDASQQLAGDFVVIAGQFTILYNKEAGLLRQIAPAVRDDYARSQNDAADFALRLNF